MTTVSDPLQVASRVARVLDDVGVRYTVGGSIASSLMGEPRSTLDVDIVVALAAGQVAPLLAGLGAEFYADEEAFHRAVRDGSSVNAIHKASGIKVDFFVARTALDHQQLRRRQRLVIPGPDGHALWVHSAEDILLQKLVWFRLGGEQSDRQWRDVVAIWHLQRGRLDESYLSSAAADAGVSDLLVRVRALG